MAVTLAVLLLALGTDRILSDFGLPVPRAARRTPLLSELRAGFDERLPGADVRLSMPVARLTTVLEALGDPWLLPPLSR